MINILNEKSFWAFTHTIGMTSLLLLVGIVPFISPQKDTAFLKMICNISPLLQIGVLLLGIKVMGYFSTVLEETEQKNESKEHIKKQLISKQEFKTIVLVSTVNTMVFGWYILTFGDESGFTRRLLINILAVSIGVVVSADEIFSGKEKNTEGFEKPGILSDISIDYGTFASIILASIGFVLLLITRGTEKLDSIRYNVFVIICWLILIIIAAVIDNKK